MWEVIMLYSTEHSRMRFVQRVKNVDIPKRNKQKFIEQYIKKAFKDGLTPKDIDDLYLKHYMNSKLKQDIHYLIPTKITHYKNNLFLFKGRTCITVLEMPEKARDAIDNNIYISKLKSFINCINEKQIVKKWLLEYSDRIEKTKDIKRCIVNIPENLSYDYLMNHFPLNSIKYIKNDSKFKKTIIGINKKRKYKIKERYYFIYALLMLFPKNQILKLQTILKNNKNSIFCKLNIDIISQKQLNLAYKQLYIMLGEKLQPRYAKFNINDNLCYDIISDHLNNIIDDYIISIKEIFKDKNMKGCVSDNNGNFRRN